jgi:hypothetical protein
MELSQGGSINTAPEAPFQQVSSTTATRIHQIGPAAHLPICVDYNAGAISLASIRIYGCSKLDLVVSDHDSKQWNNLQNSLAWLSVL